VVVIALGAILAVGTLSGIGAGVGDGQRCIAPECGKQGQGGLSSHLESVGVPEVPVQEQGGQREQPSNQAPQGVPQGFDPSKLWGKRDVCLVFVRTALGTPLTTFGTRGFGLLGGRLGLAGGLLCIAAHHRLATHRKRAPGLDAHERQREAGQPGDGLAIPARKETIQAMRALAGCGDDAFIARNEGDVTRTVPMVPEADPQQEAPRADRGDKALDGALAAAWARPAGHAEPGDASGHHQERTHYPAALAQGGCWEGGLKAWQECDNVHGGLLVG
jgi:hypothetical protein